MVQANSVAKAAGQLGAVEAAGAGDRARGSASRASARRSSAAPPSAGGVSAKDRRRRRQRHQIALAQQPDRLAEQFDALGEAVDVARASPVHRAIAQRQRDRAQLGRQMIAVAILGRSDCGRRGEAARSRATNRNSWSASASPCPARGADADRRLGPRSAEARNEDAPDRPAAARRRSAPRPITPSSPARPRSTPCARVARPPAMPVPSPLSAPVCRNSSAL